MFHLSVGFGLNIHYSPGGCRFASSSITGTNGFFSFTINFLTDCRLVGRIFSAAVDVALDDDDADDIGDDDCGDDNDDDDDDGFGDF